MTSFPTLFSPFTLGHLRLRNRIVLAPHSTHYADRVETDRLAAYYAERARDGVGLIVHEPVIVHPSSLSRAGKVWGYEPTNATAYHRTTDLAHSLGAAIVCQLIHNGRQVDGFASGMPAWYPSVASRSGTSETTHEMSVAEIAEVVDGFAQTARICRAGGFDGVEVHASHGYLLQAFLSPATNHRTDGYGGSPANRARIVREVVQAIRAAVGADFIVGLRVTGDEAQAGGLDADAALESAAYLAEPGSGVDYLSVVSGSLASYDRIVPDSSFPRGLNIGFAARIRERVQPVPVIVTGRIAEPADAEAALTAGQADLVGVVRAMIADPRWVDRAASGELELIRPCVYANDCRDSIGGRRSLECMVNPDAGHETRVAAASTVARRIVVVGGGVAGMEAAVEAAQRGDDVVLFERAGQLGGQLLLAARAPSRAEFTRLVGYLSGRLASLGADVKLGHEADLATVAELHPDLVVLASGARPRASRFAGPHTVDSWTVLAGTAPVLAQPPGQVVLFDESGGNGWPLFTTAEVLVGAGHTVAVVSAASAIGTSVEAASLPPLLRRLRAEIHLTSTLTQSPEGRLTIRDLYTGAEVTRTPLALVVEPGRGPVDGLAQELRERAVPVAVIGDALAPRRVSVAIREARAAIRSAVGAG